MAIHIHGAKQIRSSPDDGIQLMPFKIDVDCEAEVSIYFKPFVKTTEHSNYSSSFRGHPLVGKKLNLPKGYTGVILNERVAPDTDDSDRNFYIASKFDTFMHWNYDKTPSLNDAIMQVLNVWVDIAEALHSPV
ncbi:hypothetical protein FQR65_LT14388 [Abscondita terminalis]|nr:hypothetical protein FQR65_LT14388 [Abscondita terminalis]